MQRKFKVYAVKQASEAGLGIEEYRGEDPSLAIASLYVPEALSNKELFDAIAGFIYKQLNPSKDDTAFLRITYPIRYKYQWTKTYNGYIFVRSEPDPQHIAFRQAKRLAEDAMRRKSSVTEVLVAS